MHHTCSIPAVAKSTHGPGASIRSRSNGVMCRNASDLQSKASGHAYCPSGWIINDAMPTVHSLGSKAVGSQSGKTNKKVVIVDSGELEMPPEEPVESPAP